MGVEEKKPEAEMSLPTETEENSHAKEDVKEAEQEKSIVPVANQKKTTAVTEKVAEPVERNIVGSFDRDAALARVAKEKRLALVKAWEESEKTKVENRTYKKLSGIQAREDTKRATVEAELKKIEEKLEKKKSVYGETMKNKIAEIHKTAQEKRAKVEAKKGEEFCRIEEAANKFRSTGFSPRKFLGCLSG